VELDINLAGIRIGMIFLDHAQKAVPLLERCFQGYVEPRGLRDTEIVVSLLGEPGPPFPLEALSCQPIVEQRLSAAQVAEWLGQHPDCHPDAVVTDETILALSLGGLLLFDPPTGNGHIYLLKQGPECFQPLLHLSWMYFAQVLGEKGCCFVHGAALAKGGKGYLFIGHSGAGKSTVASQCNGSIVLSDDSPIFRKENGRFCLFASPYHQLRLSCGQDERAPRMSVPAKGLYFLNQSDHLHLEMVSRPQAVSMLLGQHIHFFAYLSRRAKASLFDLFLEACNRLPAYRFYFGLGCNPLDFVADHGDGEKHVGFRQARFRQARFRQER
jgi:hypothetical protein